MKFRTEIAIKPWSQTIDHSHHILSLGSCFADNIARHLARHKFRVVASPTGILFNPLSIAQSVEAMYNGKAIEHKELIESGVTLELYGDKITLEGKSFEKKIFEFDTVSAITLLGKNKLDVYADGKVYQIKGSERFCALKYVNLFHRYKNVTTEVKDGLFLGI